MRRGTKKKVRRGSDRESESERHGREQESGEKGKRKSSDQGRECFYPHVHSVRGSLSAIVPGLPVKTAWLPKRLFTVKRRRTQTHISTLTHACARMCTQVHVEPPKTLYQCSY